MYEYANEEIRRLTEQYKRQVDKVIDQIPDVLDDVNGSQDDLNCALDDAVSELTTFIDLSRPKPEFKPEYERLTGHEIGVCSGKV